MKEREEEAAATLMPPKAHDAPHERLERFIRASSSAPSPAAGLFRQNPPVPPLPPSTPGKGRICDFGGKHDFDHCGTDRYENGVLYVQGEGDVDDMDPNDIRQNRLGDCHLLGPAVAMLQLPEGRARLKRMISEVKTADGRSVAGYDVTFHDPDQNKDVKVHVSAREFVKGHVLEGDTRATDRKVEVWPMVLEAAYGKLRGGANNIAYGGRGTDALSILTGKKAEEKTLDPKNAYSASKLQTDFETGKPICVTFTRQGDNKSGPAVAKYGAYGYHCYALSGFITKNGVTYAQLRNPWGKNDPAPIPVRDLEELKPQISVGQRI